MKTILLLTDFSKKADHAAEFALEIAERAGADILLYNAYNVQELVALPGAGIWHEEAFLVAKEESCTKLQKVAQRLRQKAQEKGASEFTPSVSCISQVGCIVENITELVSQKNVWLVVMGTKGDNGVSNFLFGSNAYAAIDKAGCPVLLVPEKAELGHIRKIALATDLQPSNMQALEFLAEVASSLHSELVVTHVSSTEAEQKKAPEFVQQLLARLSNLNTSYQDIKGEQVETKLEEFTSEEKVDILTLIHKKYNFLERIFHSSTTKVLIRHAKVPLLVLPA